jgi:hypothetical protein
MSQTVPPRSSVFNGTWVPHHHFDSGTDYLYRTYRALLLHRRLSLNLTLYVALKKHISAMENDKAPMQQIGVLET